MNLREPQPNDNPVSLLATVTAPQEFIDLVQQNSDAIRSDAAGADEAKFLAVNDNYLSMSRETKEWVWDTLADHYGAQGVPVEGAGVRDTYARNNNVRAAIDCERFDVPLETAVHDFSTNDWTAAVQPHLQYSYLSSSVSFSTFIGGCQRVALIGEIGWQRAVLDAMRQEAMSHPSAHRHNEFEGMEARITALTDQLSDSGLLLSEPETTLPAVFSNTETARLFTAHSTFVLPEAELPAIGMLRYGRNYEAHRTQQHALGRIMRPLAQQ